MKMSLSMFKFTLMLLFMTTSTLGFPMGRCFVRSCDSSPYNIRVSEARRGRMCYSIDAKECMETNARFQCCQNFINSLNKIVFESHPRCNRSVAGVTVNGQMKGGGVSFDIDSGSGNNGGRAELRVTALRMNYTQALAATICVNLQGECVEPRTFCQSQNEDGCLAAVFDPLGHTCCPTCRIPFQNSPDQTRPGPSPSPMPRPPVSIRVPPPSATNSNSTLMQNLQCTCQCVSNA